MVGAELVVGYVFAWLAGKGRLAARRADWQVDQAVDGAVDRLGGKLHDLVAGKLRGDASLVRLNEELVRQLQAAQRRGPVSAEAGGVAVGGDVRVQAESGSFAAGVVQGDVSFGNPPAPGTAQA